MLNVKCIKGQDWRSKHTESRIQTIISVYSVSPNIYARTTFNMGFQNTIQRSFRERVDRSFVIRTHILSVSTFPRIFCSGWMEKNHIKGEMMAWYINSFWENIVITLVLGPHQSVRVLWYLIPQFRKELKNHAVFCQSFFKKIQALLFVRFWWRIRKL